ncbi:uncharacterized protein LOC101234411 isoform X2 [Hydra vulgaris]|uniref:Uncharacterized protein LOC101234411 isoform X2 n=1 Tax=Hydra vulgaris TaxID=6087 RepID=A0ABM4BE49_HYDVU
MSATSFEKDIACLDERIKKLHCLVFSNCSTSSCKIFEVVEQAKCTLKEVETRHLVVTLLWKKLPQLQEFLDTEFIKKIKLTDEVKTSLILANEENIRNLSKNLEELKKLQNVVNHPSLKDIPIYSEKLLPLMQIQVDQEAELKDFCARLEQLLVSYNTIINTLSKQFILWNNMVTQCEYAVDSNRAAIE